MFVISGEKDDEDDDCEFLRCFSGGQPVSGEIVPNKPGKCSKKKLPHTDSKPGKSTLDGWLKPSQEYETYVSLVDDDDWADFYDEESDAELKAAIEASLLDVKEPSLKETHSVKQALSSFISATLFKQNEELEASGTNILVSRKSVLNSTLRAIKRNSFSFFKPLSVTFSGEAGVDTGGPKLEYLRLLMVSIKDSGVFQGSWFCHNAELLSSGRYKLSGKLVAWSILQGGPGLNCLAKVGLQLFKGLPFDREEAIANVGDFQLLSVLRAIQESSTERDFSEKVIDLYADYIAQYAYPRIYTTKVAKKEEIVDCLLKQYYVYGVYASIQQFLEGMNEIGNFGDVVLSNQAIFEQLLCDCHVKLTTQRFKDLYQIAYSEVGSNSRIKEDSTIYCFEVFLQDLEEGEANGLALEDLLVFISGASKIPPLGFTVPIRVKFYDDVLTERRRPWSSTCSLTLNIPRGYENPEQFKSLMLETLQECQGFGLV